MNVIRKYGFKKLKSILARIEPYHFFTRDKRRFARYEIGEYSYGSPILLFENEDATLKIGKFCSIARGVTFFLGGEHRYDWITTYPFNEVFAEAYSYKGSPSTKGDVWIGNDVWIGLDAVVLSGVIIGHGAVIGARSVVTKNVPPYAIVAGNPARVVRYRFTDSQIEALLAIAWWDWPIDQVKAALPLLLNPNIDSFIEQYHPTKITRLSTKI
ncbi:MAG: CatB-related O-acetyltransferase [Anaerolineae bacterium]|nr:CatB-related O-acetyltransferase [Anaerolineae bacterium]